MLNLETSVNDLHELFKEETNAITKVAGHKRPRLLDGMNPEQARSEGASSVAFEVQIINCQIYFIYLFIFNCLTLNINFFIFNLFDVKFLFSENNVFCKQKRMAVYGHTSLFSDLKLTRENDDQLSSRHIWIFEVPHPVQEYTKMQLPGKRYQTNTVRSFEVLGSDHFGRYRTKICEIQVRL